MAVMVVDPDAGERQRLAALVRQAGFPVRAAATGATALRLVQRSRPQLVLLEPDLPEMSGWEVCRALCQAGLRVLCLSRLTSEEAVLCGLELGATAYLPKPVSSDRLLAHLQAVLRRPVPGPAFQAVAVPPLPVTEPYPGLTPRAATPQLWGTSHTATLLQATARR